jgi:hypothetical protein
VERTSKSTGSDVVVTGADADSGTGSDSDSDSDSDRTLWLEEVEAINTAMPPEVDAAATGCTPGNEEAHVVKAHKEEQMRMRMLWRAEAEVSGERGDRTGAGNEEGRLRIVRIGTWASLFGNERA